MEFGEFAMEVKGKQPTDAEKEEVIKDFVLYNKIVMIYDPFINFDYRPQWKQPFEKWLNRLSPESRQENVKLLKPYTATVEDIKIIIDYAGLEWIQAYDGWTFTIW